MTSLDEIVALAKDVESDEGFCAIDEGLALARAALALAPIVKEGARGHCFCTDMTAARVPLSKGPCFSCRRRSLVSNVGKEGAP